MATFVCLLVPLLHCNATDKAKKADSLTDHLFGPPKCESFRPIGPQPYEPVLNNVRTVRS